MDKEYYYTDQEWSKIIGYGSVPVDRLQPAANDAHWNGEQQLNKSTGQVEVYYNGDWTVK